MIFNSSRKQEGVTLVVSLVILVTLTMLGLSSIQRTTSELTMAGNQRESGLMFHAAEVGLVSAENFVEAQTSNSVYSDASKGLYNVNINRDNPSYVGPSYFDESSWATGSQLAATFIKNVIEQPRYVIEYLGDRKQNPLAQGLNIGGGYGQQETGDIVSIYRSTSRGTGVTGNSFRFVQSFLGKDAP